MDASAARDHLERLASGGALATADAYALMGAILSGELTPTQIAAVLVALRVRGESEDEILGFAKALRAHARPLPPMPRPLLDTCGTGGDGQGTWNLSTGAALIAAAQGARVVKHGNRAQSSRCGSADVLEALGIRIDLAPEEVPRWIDDAGFAFLFAPSFHPAMKHAAPVRRELGVRTVMNLLGPLANPAAADRQVVGLFSARWLEPVARILSTLDVSRALVVHSRDGMDELSPSDVTDAVWLENGHSSPLTIEPEDLLGRRAPPGSLRGGDAATNARALKDALSGSEGPLRDALILNGGAALWVWGVSDLRAAVAQAREAIDSGRVVELLSRLRRISAPS